MRLILYFVFFAVLSGCAALEEQRRARLVKMAQKDHAACTERGFEFPSEKYRKCRLAEIDERDRKLWMEMQMSQRSNEPSTPEFIIPNTPNRIEDYRPIDEKYFECEKRYFENLEYIYCDTH